MNEQELKMRANQRLTNILAMNRTMYFVPIASRTLTRRYRVFGIDYVNVTPDKTCPVLVDLAGYISTLTGRRWKDGVLSGRNMTPQDVAEQVSQVIGVSIRAERI